MYVATKDQKDWYIYFRDGEKTLPAAQNPEDWKRRPMSALPPKSGHVQCIHLCLLWAKSGHDLSVSGSCERYT
jgi:hypothetical protein